MQERGTELDKMWQVKSWAHAAWAGNPICSWMFAQKTRVAHTGEWPPWAPGLGDPCGRAQGYRHLG